MNQFLIMKFGGTSVGSAARMKEVAQLLQTPERKIVVLSAMSGTTNALVEITNYFYKKNNDTANELISQLESKYYLVINELYQTPEIKEKAQELIKTHFDYIRQFTIDMFTSLEEKAILAQGELLSTALFHYFLQEQGINSVLLPALNFMRIDRSEEPDNYYIRENLNREIADHQECELFITQGYICRNAFGEIDNLKRGGSDYSAAIIGAAVKASEIQIWTDIDGFHNNDPRFVENTHPISELSFDEAAELAYFGAKILHPSTVLPAKLLNIPVRLKNTMCPDAYGTLITNNSTNTDEIKAVAAKDGITAIKIKSGRMLLAYGFLRRVFETFERYKTSIDMITTSEIAVSLTIDSPTNLDKIVDELKQFGTVAIDSEQTIVCVVGSFTTDKAGVAAKVFNAMKDIPMRMISYGGSENNISILIHSTDKVRTLKALNEHLFATK